ncbi:MAG: SO_0444 family Cu/Zn efflux transporter [Desulfosoma sp.]
MEILFKILWESFRILAASAPYVLFGLAAAGCVRAFVPTSLVKRQLGGRGLGPIIKASLWGIPLPLCSCGVLPVAIDLRNQGVGKGPAAAFLVSVPETGVDSMAVTYALLGPVFTVIRPVAAFLTATVTGVLVSCVRDVKDSKTSGFCQCFTDDSKEQALSVRPWPRRLGEGFRYAFVDLLRDMGGWLLLGILLSGLIGVLVPEDFSRWISAGEGRSMLLMLIAGIPLYMCASASTPIGAVLMADGLSPGAALVFLLVGPATNAATLTVLNRFWGKAATTVYLLGVSSCSLFMGWLTNRFFEAFGIGVHPLGSLRVESGIDPVGGICAAVFVALWLWSVVAIRWSGLPQKSPSLSGVEDPCPSST